MTGAVDIARFATASAFANMVVLAVLAGMLVMVAGLAYTFLDRRRGAGLLAHGAVLVAAFGLLAAQQFGAVPVTFDGVAKLGMATFPSGALMDAYRAGTTWVLDKIGWGASVMMGVGAVWLLAARGSDASFRLLLVGGAISAIGTLVGTGGIVTWILALAGVHVPVVA